MAAVTVASGRGGGLAASDAVAAHNERTAPLRPFTFDAAAPGGAPAPRRRKPAALLWPTAPSSEASSPSTVAQPASSNAPRAWPVLSKAQMQRPASSSPTRRRSCRPRLGCEGAMAHAAGGVRAALAGPARRRPADGGFPAVPACRTKWAACPLSGRDIWRRRPAGAQVAWPAAAARGPGARRRRAPVCRRARTTLCRRQAPAHARRARARPRCAGGAAAALHRLTARCNSVLSRRDDVTRAGWTWRDLHRAHATRCDVPAAAALAAT